MKQFMFFSFEESFVQRHDHRVFITFRSGCLGTVACQSRLASTHNTASAARHYFDQMVILLSALHLLHNCSCICQSTDNADIQVDSLIRNGELSDKSTVTNTTLGNSFLVPVGGSPPRLLHQLRQRSHLRRNQIQTEYQKTRAPVLQIQYRSCGSYRSAPW